MKDTHDMTRLELEIEVTELRQQVHNLIEEVKRKNQIINIYGNYIDEHNIKVKKLERTYDNEKKKF